jgi:hypothetical protein
MGGEKRVASPDTGGCRKRRNARLPMRVVLFGLSLGVLSSAAEDAGSIPPVVLFTGFQTEPPAAVMSSLRDELADIMRPTGIRFEWRPLPTVELGQVATQLAVVSFKGRCDLSGINPLLYRAGVLGITHVSEGVIIPFTDIDCDAIRNLIQRDLLLERAGRRESIYGRAIARVLAHELYHILANTAKHGSCGLGKSSFSANDLLAGSFHFEPGTMFAVQDGKVMANLKRAAHARRSPPIAAAAEPAAAH